MKERSKISAPLEYKWNKVTTTHVKSPDGTDASEKANENSNTNRIADKYDNSGPKVSSSIDLGDDHQNLENVPRRRKRVKHHGTHLNGSISLSGSLSGHFPRRASAPARTVTSHDQLYDLSLFDLVDELS